MARPSKTLSQRVAERSFVARRHRDLLGGPFVADPELRDVQRRFQLEDGGDPGRRRLAREFERVVRDRPESSLLERIRDMDFEVFCSSVLGFELPDFQRDFSGELGRLHDDGKRVYRLAILGIGRGGGKTWLSAAIGLYELLRRTDAPSVLLAASVKDQGELAYGYISRWVRASPMLREVVTLTKAELLVPETSGKLRVISSLGDSAFGETPSVVIADELHVWRTDQHKVLWEALISGMGKLPDSVMIAITTATAGSDSLLAGILDRELAKPMLEQRGDCLRVVRDDDGAVLLWWYGAPEDADLDDEQVWKESNPQPWKTLREFRFERGMLSDEAFSRLILNRSTVELEDQLVSSAMWNRCLDPELVPPEGATVHLGVESSFGGRTVAIGLAWRAPDGRVAVAARVFATEREPTAAHERMPGWRERVDVSHVIGWIADIASSFRPRSLAFDEHELRLKPMQLLELGLSLPVTHVRSGSAAQKEASRRLYAMIENRELAHVGDEVLAAHICGTRGTFDRDQKLAVYRRDQERQITAWYGICQALTQMPEQPSIYEQRGVLHV